jgi:hypothetical protein
MKVSTGKIHTIMKTKNIFLTAISALYNPQNQKFKF